MIFNTSNFTSKYITKRNKSLFSGDMLSNADKLRGAIEGKSILVIGGGGTIGGAFIKTVLPFKPSSLVAADISENNLAELTRDIRGANLFIPNDYKTYPVDYRDDVFKKIFLSRKGFDIVANFSAHKHVRSEKDIFSIEALLRNNAVEIIKLFDLLMQYPPEKFFCVSTDKAANPVNIMGASKRIMEDIIFSYSDKINIKTARFANVAFSNGSLPAGFIERINKLQPIAAPNDIKRYFVSIEESGEICALACMLGNTREIFFPKFLESQMMTFSEIAEKMLNELGYAARNYDSAEKALLAAENIDKTGEYPVFFSPSDTTGEKDFEEFYTKEESVDMKRFESLGVITGIKKTNITLINELLNKLNNAFLNEKTKKEDIVNIVCEYIPNFTHLEKSKNLDSKM